MTSRSKASWWPRVPLPHMTSDQWRHVTKIFTFKMNYPENIGVRLKRFCGNFFHMNFQIFFSFLGFSVMIIRPRKLEFRRMCGKNFHETVWVVPRICGKNFHNLPTRVNKFETGISGYFGEHVILQNTGVHEDIHVWNKNRKLGQWLIPGSSTWHKSYEMQ